MPRPDRAAAVARQSGFWDSDALARCVLACGFDPDRYLDKNAGLRMDHETIGAKLAPPIHRLAAG